MNPPLGDLKLKTVKVTGKVDVKRIEPEDEWETSKRYIILLMGPTGAGKSSFIESFAGQNSSLPRLSSGRLEGYTQDVAAYIVEGVKSSHNNPLDADCTVYLIDTPGFADDKISALEIVSKTQSFLNKLRPQANGSLILPYILYFTPITSTRLPGSQRSVLRMFKALTGLKSSGGITVVTTMWDTLWGWEAEKRAERNFEQLTSDIWKDLTQQSTKITKFHNTCVSALQVLDLAIERNRYSNFALENAISDGVELSRTTFGPEMHTDLVDRIQSLHVRKKVILAELVDPSTAGNDELIAILNSDLRHVNSTLAKFEQQLADFGPQASHVPSESTSPSDTVDPIASYCNSPTKPSQPSPSTSTRSPSTQEVRRGWMPRIKYSTKRRVEKITRTHPDAQ